MERGLTADDVARALWRRPWLVAAVTGTVLVLGTLYVMTRPKVWKATSVVTVEPSHADSQLVQRTVGDVEPRLLSIRQELMGRPVLERVVDQLHLFPALVARRGKEAAIEQLREDIEVKPTGNAFEVMVSASEPKRAAEVANLVPVVYGQLTSEVRAAQAKDATQVFEAQIKELQNAVTSWERRIVQFKVDHVGELPEQVEANMRQLDRIASELRSKGDELRSAENRRSEVTLLKNGMDTEIGRNEAVVDQLAQQLASVKTQFTDDHPEVQRLSREMQAAQSRARDAGNRAGVQRQERSRAERVVAGIHQEIDAMQKEAALYQARLERTPRWAAELGGLEREYEIAKAKYQSVVGRKVEAEIAQELETRNAPRLFHLVSPAGVPVTAAKPDRLGGLMLVLLAALAAGVLTGVMAELRDESIRDDSELKGQLPLPVLAVVPAMGGRTERRVLLPANSGRNGSGQVSQSVN
jgi:succinoglycan biosynthesis transport protein ExoP